jgi:hypothetical protein
MKNIIAIGDIHNHWAEAEQIASKYDQTHTIVFVGDYFDDFGDTAQDAIQTAQWLKESLKKPNRVHLLGNHDINYSIYNASTTSTGIPMNIYQCSGYTLQKDAAINKVLDQDDWDKIKLYHFEHGFFFTHGGLHPHWFEHPIKGITIDYVKEKLDKATTDYHNRTWNDLIGAAGRCRGGSHKAGGILWCDAFREARLIPKIRQVFGHTPVTSEISSGVDIDTDDGDRVNINIDCGLSQVVEIFENGGFNILSTDYPNFYFQQRQKQAKKFLDSIEHGAYDKIYEQLNKK